MLSCSGVVSCGSGFVSCSGVVSCGSGFVVQSEKKCLITVLQSDVEICKASASIRSFHHFPMNELRRKQWEAAVRRDGWCSAQYSQICGAHFVKRYVLTYFLVAGFFKFIDVYK